MRSSRNRWVSFPNQSNPPVLQDVTNAHLSVSSKLISDELHLCVRLSSSDITLLLHAQTFLGISAASCLFTWRNCESLFWVMCVYSPQATEVTPSRHWQRCRHLRVAISEVARLGELPHCLCCLLAIWPRSGWRGMEGSGRQGGALIGRSLQCFQKHRVLAASLNVMQKNACC